MKKTYSVKHLRRTCGCKECCRLTVGSDNVQTAAKASCGRFCLSAHSLPRQLVQAAACAAAKHSRLSRHEKRVRRVGKWATQRKDCVDTFGLATAATLTFPIENGTASMPLRRSPRLPMDAARRPPSISTARRRNGSSRSSMNADKLAASRSGKRWATTTRVNRTCNGPLLAASHVPPPAQRAARNARHIQTRPRILPLPVRLPALFASPRSSAHRSAIRQSVDIIFVAKKRLLLAEIARNSEPLADDT